MKVVTIKILHQFTSESTMTNHNSRQGTYTEQMYPWIWGFVVGL